MIRAAGAAAAVAALVAAGCGGNAKEQAAPPTTETGVATTTSARGPQSAGPTDPARRIHFSLNLRFEDAAFQRYLDELNDPSSPNYRKYLAPETIGERYGLPLAEVQRVRTIVQRAGFQVDPIPAERQFLAAHGTVRDAARFFRVAFRDFIDPDGRRYYTTVPKPRIPRAIARSVTGVAGLDQTRVAVSADLPAGGMDPPTTAKAYNVRPLHANGFLGQGQTIAIVSFDTFKDSDVALFDKKYITPYFRFTPSPVEHVRLDPGMVPGDGAVEVNLDIDTIRQAAPRATILNYEASNNLGNFARIMDRIVTDGRAKIVSISWGTCDADFPANDPTRLSIERSFQRAQSRGLSVFVASGDAGAYDCQRTRDIADHRPTTSFPSNTPWVISVGGTLLSTRADGTYLEETGWEDPLSNGGGGGGHNPISERPEWQTGPGVQNRYSNGKRQVPDVAASSDPDSGWFIVNDGEVGVVGGTSAAAPFWAGMTALIAQYAKKRGVGDLGFIAPDLYELARTKRRFPPFHDVTRGGNRLHDATPGWDYSTGLGSPNAWNLARELVALLKSR